MTIDPNIVLLVIIALSNAVTGYMAWRTQRDMAEVKHETNSMKDALVTRTGQASDAAGYERGRVEGEAKAAVLAEGQRQGAEAERASVAAVPVDPPKT